LFVRELIVKHFYHGMLDFTHYHIRAHDLAIVNKNIKNIAILPDFVIFVPSFPIKYLHFNMQILL